MPRIAYAREAMRWRDPQLVVLTAAVPAREPFCALPEVQELFVEMRLLGWLKERTKEIPTAYVDQSKTSPWSTSKPRAMPLIRARAPSAP